MNTSAKPRFWTTKMYNRLSRYYDAFMRTLFPAGEKGRKRVVEKMSTGRVLDVACGTGTLLELAARKGISCFGIDISDGMLEIAKSKRMDAEIINASYYDIPYPDNQFDYVVATNALSGGYIEPEKVLSEMIRVCKVGGEVFITEWPKAREDTFTERLIVWLASFSDDAPKDYEAIFRTLGYIPEIEKLEKRYYLYGIKKKLMA
ncbi:MAG: class I SAM-dependent methyltransferase [Anaerolineaceae bacterium]|nr:class I SAM-dependent methyltransferase [Anaerolineaceae bacterium]